MVNKERRYKTRTKARGAILWAGAVQAVLAILTAASAAQAGDIFSFALFGLVELGLAVFFLLLRHPAWGIAATVIFVVGRMRGIMGLLTLEVFFTPVTWVGLIIGGGVCLALTVFFIYADYQAVLLRRLDREIEEQDEEE